MAEELHVKGKDLKDLKVVELKKELAERGLTVTGNKSDLIARLEDYLLKQGPGDDLEEIEVEGVLESDIEQIGNRDFDQELSEDMLDEQDSSELDSKTEQSTDEKVEEEQSENTPPATEPVKIQINHTNKESVKPDKKVPLDTTKTESERKADRQQRFGVALDEKQKKEVRAKRFGALDTNTASSQPLNSAFPKNSTDREKLTKRAERFGSKVNSNNVDMEKLSKRAERFGAVSPLVTKTAEEEKIKKRKERFGVAIGGLSSDAEARKRLRAERFK